MKKKKLNLGSGNDYIKGWINVDIVPGYKVDVVADLQKPFPFEDNSIDEIKASDILEHFTKEDGETFLRECHRVLKVGGRIWVRTHNVYQIFRQFSEDPDVLVHFLYGGNTEVTGIFGAHKFAYTKEYAHYLFKKIGLTIASFDEETTNHIIVATKDKLHKQKPLNILFLVSSSHEKGRLIQKIIQVLRDKHRVVEMSSKDLPRMLIKSSFDGVVLQGTYMKIIATFIAYLRGMPLFWIEDQNFHISDNKFMSKALYKFVRKIPSAILVADQQVAHEFMIHTRISQSKIAFLTKPSEIAEKIEDTILYKRS